MSRNIMDELNPEFVRSLRVTLPRRRAVFLAVLTLSIVAAGGWLLWNNNYYAPGQWMSGAAARAMQKRQFGRQSFEMLTVVLFCLLYILAPATAGLSFIQERLRGTAIFQQMSLLSPFRLAAGKYLGSAALAYFIAALVLPFAFVAASLGKVDPDKVARLFLFLFVGGLAWQAIGLFISSVLSAPAEKALRGGLLVGPAVGVGGAVTAIALYDYFVTNPWPMAGLLNVDVEYQARHYWWHFYGAGVPAYVLILGVLVFVGGWAFVGATRRIKAWQLIPVGPYAVWAFFASATTLVVGLMWGRHAGDVEPNARIGVFLFLNWVALTVIAGSSVLTRGRLREWWSAERDPLAVFRREEIKNSLKTFLFVLCAAEAGLAALWYSYHLTPDGRLAGLGVASQLAPIAICFALTVVGMALFIQFCALHRFRIGGWAGVCLTVIFYLFVTSAGVLFDNLNNTPALLNPLVYVEALTRGDIYMDSQYRVVSKKVAFDARMQGRTGRSADADASDQYTAPVGEPDGGRRSVLVVRGPQTARFGDVEYVAYNTADYELSSARARGFVAESLLALFCFGLAHVKWTKTREEMLEEGGRNAAAAP